MRLTQTKRAARTLGVACLLALMLLSAQAVSRADPVQCPDPAVWNAQVWTEQGWGPGPLRDGVKGLEFASQARAPIRFVVMAQTYMSNVVSGPVQTLSVMRDTPPYTFTWALSDQGDPVQGEVEMGCYLEIPSEVSNEIEGRIMDLDCGTIGSGRCYFWIEAWEINGRRCDEPTPER